MAVTPHGRLSPRTPMVMPCKISDCEEVIDGMTKDISRGGMAVSLATAIPPGKYEPVRISLEKPIVVSALPVHARAETERFTVGFQITSIEAGEQEWQHLTVARR